VGYQLWVSSVTGQRRKGTDFTSLQKIFIDSVTVRDICEPLHCCDVNISTSELIITLNDLDFDSVGVVNDNHDIFGYILRNDLSEGNVNSFIRHFDTESIVSDSTSIPDVFKLISEREFYYVNYGQGVKYIVSKADLNKPPVRIYIFGMMSLFELHLNYWVDAMYSSESWANILNPKRVENARLLFENARKNNENESISLISYLQLCDKRTVLCASETFLELFDFNKNKFKYFLKKTETLRNNLAHSQNSIFTDLNIQDVSLVLNVIESFLLRSEAYVLSRASS